MVRYADSDGGASDPFGHRSGQYRRCGCTASSVIDHSAQATSIDGIVKPSGPAVLINDQLVAGIKRSDRRSRFQVASQRILILAG